MRHKFSIINALFLFSQTPLPRPGDYPPNCLRRCPDRRPVHRPEGDSGHCLAESLGSHLPESMVRGLPGYPVYSRAGCGWSRSPDHPLRNPPYHATGRRGRNLPGHRRCYGFRCPLHYDPNYAVSNAWNPEVRVGSEASGVTADCRVVTEAEIHCPVCATHRRNERKDTILVTWCLGGKVPLRTGVLGGCGTGTRCRGRRVVSRIGRGTGPRTGGRGPSGRVLV
jgi:hypothetical protein